MLRNICCTVLCTLAPLTIHAQSQCLPTLKYLDALVAPKTQSFSLEELTALINQKEWSKIRSYVKKTDIHLKNLEQIAQAHPDTPFSSAVQATKKIQKIVTNRNLPLSTLFTIALFAETDLSNKIAQKKFFWPAKVFGRELEVDRKSHRLFIHLGAGKENIVGKGRLKMVIKTILYDKMAPEVMAYGFTKSSIEREVLVMKALKNLPNLMHVEGYLYHKDPHSSKMIYGLVTKIYNSSSLQDVINKKSSKLTLREKIVLARDLVSGLKAMHSHHYVHRDLGVKNYFIHIVGKKPDHRIITGCVADMGRATHTKRIGKMAVQGNSWYMPPEGFFPEKMRPKDYYQSDLFAFGCAMWNLYYGKLPEWSYKRYFKYGHGSMKARQKAHIALIKKVRAEKAKDLHYRGSRRRKFLRLIIKMTDPSPKKRGTTASTKRALNKIIDW